MTQRPSKVPTHYRDKLNVLLKELEKYNIINKLVPPHKTSLLWHNLFKPSHYNPQGRYNKMCIRRSTP